MKLFFYVSLFVSVSSFHQGYLNRCHVMKKFTLLCKETNGDDLDFKRSLIFGKNDLFIDAASVRTNAWRWNILAVFLIVASLGGNLFGSTSAIMSFTNPEFFRSIKADTIYPILGFQRFLDREDQYEYIYPKNWLGDQRITIAELKERELPRLLRESKTNSLRPDSAFNPPKASGKENASVMKSQILPGFSLHKTLGDPKDAATKLLSTVIAPPGSGKIAELLAAYESQFGQNPAYIFEYTVQKENDFYQHSISVIMSRGTELYTLTAVAPENIWNKEGDVIKEIANSFRVASLSTPVGFY